MTQTPDQDGDDPGGGARARPLVSVVIPTHNEAANIGNMIEEIRRVLGACQVGMEIVVVDDGSTDGTFDEVRQAFGADPCVRAIRFSRNFGKEAALLAGLSAARGEAIITIDADFQHPPSLIPALLKQWNDGARVVHGVKRSRSNDPWIVRRRAAAFNALMARMTGLDMRNSSDFKLLDRIAVDAIVHELRERKRFYRGLTTWIGYPAAAVPFDVGVRQGGQASMSLRPVLALGTGAVVAFTTAPLRIVTLLGALTLCFGFVVGAEALVSWWRGAAVSGFATLLFTVLLVGSFIMISLGIIGEYIAKLYDEIKARPSYLIEATKGFNDPDDRPPANRHPSPDRRRNSRKSAP